MSLSLPAVVTNQQAGELVASIGGAVQDGALRIDAAALADFDTAALALLLEARRVAQSDGARFEVVGAPPKLVELARLYGVEGLLALG